MKKLSTVVAVVGLAVSSITGGAFVANAKEAPLKDGWTWTMPDGSKIGQCADGYAEVVSHVKDHEGQKYWAAYSKRGGWKQTYNLTWDELQEVMAQDWKDDARANPRIWGVMNLSSGVIETVVNPSDVKLGELYENDCVKNGYTIPVGEPNNGKDDVIVPVPTPTPTETTPVTPAPQPSEPPAVPVPTETTPAPPPVVTEPPVVLPPAPTPTVTPIVTKRLVQTDTYRYTTLAERARILGYIKDGKLTFREDREQWNDSTWVITEQTLTNGKVTKTKVVKAGGNGATAKGSKLTMSFVLGKGATQNAPWGRTGKVAQTYIK